MTIIPHLENKAFWGEVQTGGSQCSRGNWPKDGLESLTVLKISTVLSG